MGCGKTTFGRALARTLGREFIDLDFYIEQRFRMRIREIFALHGEAEFRRMESAMLREVGEIQRVVIACGGGTPCFDANMEYMNSRGVTVWLEAPVECLVRRILLGGARRPLTAGIPAAGLPAFIADALAQRSPFYSLAKIRHNGEELEDRRQIAQTVERFLRSYGPDPGDDS